MSFLSDYIYYSSGNETPEDYLHWGGLSILGHILGHKVSVVHGDYFEYRPHLYVCLVGDAGSGKNTALGVNMDIMIDHFPSLLLSASIQSREDIAHQMADDVTCMKTYQDGKGVLQEYRPFYILNNELASFLSVDKMKTVEFLVEIFDGKRFSTGFKKDRIENPLRKQWFRNPHVSLLAGAVPTWFMGSLRMDLFSGGLGRRLIIVNSVREKIIPVPMKPHGADAAMQRVVEHLKEAEKFVAKVHLTDHALKTWWDPWYKKHRETRQDDPILSQFHQTMSMQLLKVALLLRCTELPLGKELTADHLEAARLLINGLMPQIIKLTSGIGRNELAGVASQLMDFIGRREGLVSEKDVRKIFYRYANTPEFNEILTQLQTTGELNVVFFRDKTGNVIPGKTYFCSKDGLVEYERLQKELQG